MKPSTYLLLWVWAAFGLYRLLGPGPAHNVLIDGVSLIGIWLAVGLSVHALLCPVMFVGRLLDQRKALRKKEEDTAEATDRLLQARITQEDPDTVVRLERDMITLEIQKQKFREKTTMGKAHTLLKCLTPRRSV